MLDASLAVLLVGTLSLGLYVAPVAILVARVRRRRDPTRTSWRPRISILKPLAGDDDELLANLESFAHLEGYEYEILLGVASRSDPAYAAAARFLRHHPGVDARVVVTNPRAALNPKVAQLVGLEGNARGQVIVISDSNVRVTPEYLRFLMAALERPGVGLVSSVVAGTGERSVGAALESVILGGHVAPLVLAAETIAGCAITVGKSMAMRRDDLQALGGFGAVAHVLAEDHALGRLFERAGKRTSVCPVPVENRNTSCSIRRSLERHTRWAKIRRAMAPVAFVVEPLATPLVTATGALAVAPSSTTLGLWIAAVAVQVVGLQVCLRVLRGKGLPWHPMPLEVLRSYLLLLCWARSWMSRSVTWRGHRFHLSAGSTLSPVGSSPGRSGTSWA